jgi:hypothetical protein
MGLSGRYKDAESVTFAKTELLVIIYADNARAAGLDHFHPNPGADAKFFQAMDLLGLTRQLSNSCRFSAVEEVKGNEMHGGASQGGIRGG